MKSKKSFTLIEIMVVVSIISILAAILVPNVVDLTERARISRIVADIKTLDVAQETLHEDTGEYVVDAESGVSNSPSLDRTNLMFNVCGGSNWNGPYYKGSIRNPYGEFYRWDNDACACCGVVDKTDFNRPDCRGTGVFLSGLNISRARAIDDILDDGDLTRMRMNNRCGYVYRYY